MDVFLVIAQGAGLAAACGIRPFLPVLLAGALARADRGLDFERTDFAFLEAPAFLLAVVVVLFALVLHERRAEPTVARGGAVAAALAGVAIGLGALEFAGSLADEGHPAWPGVLAGLACAALAHQATRNLFTRAATRLDPGARRALPAYADGLALVLAAAVIALPPLALPALLVLAVLLLRGRRRDDSKHAGLRVLR